MKIPSSDDDDNDDPVWFYIVFHTMSFIDGSCTIFYLFIV